MHPGQVSVAKQRLAHSFEHSPDNEVVKHLVALAKV